MQLKRLFISLGIILIYTSASRITIDGLNYSVGQCYKRIQTLLGQLTLSEMEVLHLYLIDDILEDKTFTRIPKGTRQYEKLAGCKEMVTSEINEQVDDILKMDPERTRMIEELASLIKEYDSLASDVVVEDSIEELPEEIKNLRKDLVSPSSARLARSNNDQITCVNSWIESVMEAMVKFMAALATLLMLGALMSI